MERADEARALSVVAQRTPHLGNQDGQVGFDNRCVRPDQLHQFVLGDGAWPPFYEVAENIKRLRREMNGGVAPHQLAAFRIEGEVRESHAHGSRLAESLELPCDFTSRRARYCLYEGCRATVWSHHCPRARQGNGRRVVPASLPNSPAERLPRLPAP